MAPTLPNYPRIPYGVADFARIRAEKNCRYVDKTRFTYGDGFVQFFLATLKGDTRRGRGTTTIGPINQGLSATKPELELAH